MFPKRHNIHIAIIYQIYLNLIIIYQNYSYSLIIQYNHLFVGSHPVLMGPSDGSHGPGSCARTPSSTPAPLPLQCHIPRPRVVVRSKPGDERSSWWRYSPASPVTHVPTTHLENHLENHRNMMGLYNGIFNSQYWLVVDLLPSGND